MELVSPEGAGRHKQLCELHPSSTDSSFQPASAQRKEERTVNLKLCVTEALTDHREESAGGRYLERPVIACCMSKWHYALHPAGLWTDTEVSGAIFTNGATRGT